MRTPSSPPTSAKDTQALLGGDGLAHRWWQNPTLWIAMLALLLGAAALLWWQARTQANARPTYVTETVRRGDLSLTVSANGTLQPRSTVAVGSELSGTVRKVMVDVNDTVKKGQILVELDTDKLHAQLNRSRATLASAQARLEQSRASQQDAASSLARLQEMHRLSGGKMPSASELDSAQTAVARARADVAVAAASVDDARAALQTNLTDLSKAAIKSPIDGVVLTRNADPGNAVAASLQAVTLFTIAQDLTRLNLEVAVDEADVGNVTEGQRASFTVSAYPGRRYPARVTRVNYGSTKTDNVVTYTAVLTVDNDDLSLRPGMTATATIHATERKNVLLVPNAALRFTPASTNPAASDAAAASAKPGLMGQLMPRPGPNRPRARPGEASGAGQTRSVWVLQSEVGQEPQPVQVRVTTGLSDGRMTEVVGDALQEGTPLITDQRNGATP